MSYFRAFMVAKKKNTSDNIEVATPENGSCTATIVLPDEVLDNPVSYLDIADTTDAFGNQVVPPQGLVRVRHNHPTLHPNGFFYNMLLEEVHPVPYPCLDSWLCTMHKSCYPPCEATCLTPCFASAPHAKLCFIAQVPFSVEDDLLEHPIKVDLHFEACIAHGLLTTVEKVGDLIDRYMERNVRRSYNKQQLMDQSWRNILRRRPKVLINTGASVIHHKIS